MKELMKFLDEDARKGLTTIQDKQILPVSGEEAGGGNVPGPGYYEPKMPVFQPEYMQVQVSSNFKEGMRDRFGDFRDQSKDEKKSTPGPM